MHTHSGDDKIYIGKNAGKELFGCIENAKKSVKVVSPYLSPNYIKTLVKLSEKGIKITLITADELEVNPQYCDFKHSDIIKQKVIPDSLYKHKRKTGIFISFIFFFISLFGFVMSVFFIPFFYISIILIVISIIMFVYFLSIKPNKYEYYSIFRLKIFDSSSGDKPWSKELIHSKIFVIDEQVAFLGSLNFTYSGFKKHYETLIRVGDKRAVEDISKEVENLYASSFLSCKSIDELGKGVYG
ncbi:hypothetical protein GOV12_05545 [Candidatus Pacearchaeota archaeon]|nr:hypothetical protein [Candidatus Pacearchaeota archaeon]